MPLFHHPEAPEFAADSDYAEDYPPEGALVRDDYDQPPVAFSDPSDGLYGENQVEYGREGAREPGYGREELPGERGYGREGAREPGYGREEFPDERGYGREPGYGYGPPPSVYNSAPVETSDLAGGVYDSRIGAGPEYEVRHGPPGRMPAQAYGAGIGYSGELDKERKHKREAETVAAAAAAYGLYERHEKKEAEKLVQEAGLAPESNNHHHHLFGRH